MGIGAGSNVDLAYVNATKTSWTSERLLHTDLNNAVADIVDVPQVAYTRLQDTTDAVLGCGGLKGHATGEANALTSTGTTLTVPASSEWLIKEWVKLASPLSISLAAAATYYVFLVWDGTTLSLTSQATTTRPTDHPSILIAKVVSNASTLTIDQDDANVDVPVLAGAVSPYRNIAITFDGGASAVASNTLLDYEVEEDLTIESWSLRATLTVDGTYAMQIDVWYRSDTTAPTDSDSITNSHEPAMTANTYYTQDTDVTDWTSVTLVKGSVLRFNVDSCTDVKKALLTLRCKRTS